MELGQIAVPFVYGLILALGIPSQWLLLHLDPAPATSNELLWINIFLVLILITYTQTVFVDPGRIPQAWHLQSTSSKTAPSEKPTSEKEKDNSSKRKWCTKCSLPKPPRAHHCKACNRCIPKMDHHCPWTANCVSFTTFPHFLRFLLYASLGMGFLETLLFTRLHHLWLNRNLPAYLGPSVTQLFHLFAAFIANSITCFALVVLCIRNLWCLAVNTTTIEGWEIERHATLLRRARHFGGYLDALDGTRMRIKRQEFPYDIGIWKNIVQGMGTANPINWFNPFARTPRVEDGLVFETNGFEDEGTVWPPPDPDRAYRRQVRGEKEAAFTFRDEGKSNEEALEAFRRRQAEDVVRRRKPFVDRLEERQRRLSAGEEEVVYGYEYGDEASNDGSEEREAKYRDEEGEESWRNSEGERLKDFGVDEDIEFYDEHEDDIPLAELIARRKATADAGYEIPGQR